MVVGKMQVAVWAPSGCQANMLHTTSLGPDQGTHLHSTQSCPPGSSSRSPSRQHHQQWSAASADQQRSKTDNAGSNTISISIQLLQTQPGCTKGVLNISFMPPDTSTKVHNVVAQDLKAGPSKQFFVGCIRDSPPSCTRQSCGTCCHLPCQQCLSP